MIEPEGNTDDMTYISVAGIDAASDAESTVVDKDVQVNALVDDGLSYISAISMRHAWMKESQNWMKTC